MSNLDPGNLNRAIVDTWKTVDHPGAEEHVSTRSGYQKLKAKIKARWAELAECTASEFPWTDDVVKMSWIRWRKKTLAQKEDEMSRLAGWKLVE